MNSHRPETEQRLLSGRSNGPAISVLTASFNAIDGLKRTVDSVAQQVDGRACEHIVIDGGSSDGTREYLEGLGDRVRWISEPDDGIADALNKGLAMARGEWILVLQAEDRFVDCDSLAAAMPFLCGDADIVAFEVQLDLGAGRVDRRRARRFGLWDEFKMNCPHQGMFVRRALYERIGGFDTGFRIAMDYEWLLRARRSNAGLVVVHWPLAVMPATGVSTKRDWPSIRARLEEDRRLQRRHARGRIARLLNDAFWLAYLPFKRARCLIEGGD